MISTSIGAGIVRSMEYTQCVAHILGASIRQIEGSDKFYYTLSVDPGSTSDYDNYDAAEMRTILGSQQESYDDAVVAMNTAILYMLRGN